MQNTAAYERIENAGRAGVLLAAIAETNDAEVSVQRVHALAQANSIAGRELPYLLRLLEQHQFVQSSDEGVHVLGVTVDSVLEHASTIFESLGPEPQENAAIALSEKASRLPIGHDDAVSVVGDLFGVSTPDDFLREIAEIGFVDVETVRNEETIYFNGNLFRRDALNKMHGVLANLTASERQALSNANALLVQHGCIPLAQFERVLGTGLFAKLGPLGFYDLHGVSNEQGKTYFVTHPSAFSKFRDTRADAFVDDALDMAKALVACLAYGMIFRSSNEGRIRMLPALLQRLINGHEVGPATAIGRDYQALEHRGVVQVRPEGLRFYLRLLKTDVGRLALNVLTTGDTSHDVLPDFPGAAVTGYITSEGNRELKRRQANHVQRAHAHRILHTLRTGGV
jgi:hypothetical protein